MRLASAGRRLLGSPTLVHARAGACSGDTATPARQGRFCPCCQEQVDGWRDFAAHYRGVVCPRCQSHPRHRALVLYIERRTSLLSRPASVLHIGPKGAVRRRLAGLSHLRYITGDLAPGRGDIRLDVTALPFPDRHFDVVICSHVLEHVRDDRRALRELRRVLRAGGWAHLQVPLDPRRQATLEDPSIQSPEQRLKHYWQDDHLRLYGMDYEQRLREAGFLPFRVSSAKLVGAADCERFGLHQAEDLWFARRAAAEHGAGSRG